MKGLSRAAVISAAAVALAAWGSSHAAAVSSQDYVVSPKSVRAGALVVDIPPGFHRYDLRGGYYPIGVRPPLVGRVVTNYRATNGPMSPFAKWSQVREPPPAKKVALALTLWSGFGAPPPARLHVPLSLAQPWFREHLPGGTRGYRWGYLKFHQKLYEIFYWSGRAASPHDRASVLSALTSIHPAP